MWGSLVNGFSEIIQLFYKLTVALGIGNYGLAIILITVAIKLLLYPLTAKQMQSVKEMQELQPRIKEIQEKYKKQPEKAQQAIMELYREKKVNPLSGCLPLLIQLPILIAFYQALLRFPYQDPEAAGFFWISNLSSPDHTLVLPVLAALATFWQQRVSTFSVEDPTQRMMLYTMPIFMGYLAYKLPAGLALYWVVFSVLGALQQMYINHRHRAGKNGDDAAPSEGKRKKGEKIKNEPGTSGNRKSG